MDLTTNGMLLTADMKEKILPSLTKEAISKAPFMLRSAHGVPERTQRLYPDCAAEAIAVL